MPLSKIQTVDNQVISNLGRRNLIINGDMRIAQRGTSNSGVTNNGSHFLVDRFKTVVNSSYTNTVQQVEDVPDGEGFKYSLKQTFTTAKSSPSSGDYNVLDQNLEKQNIYSTENGTGSSKSITLSFFVKSSVTGTFAVALQNYGSSRRSNVLSYTISSANTWEKKVITTTADSTANTNSDNGAGLGLRFALSAGSSYEASNATTGWQTADYFGFNGATYPAGTTNATWQITGVQLEVGDTSTDFEHRPYSEELRLCMRYYEKSYNYGVVPGSAGTSAAVNYQGAIFFTTAHNNHHEQVRYKERKRAAPTLTLYNTHTGATGQNYSHHDNNSTAQSDTWANGENGARVSFAGTGDGERTEFHYTAESEI